MVGLIPFSITVVLALLIGYDSEAVSGQKMSDCWIGVILALVWYVVSFLCINGKKWSHGKQLGAYFACLFFPILGWIVVVCSKNGGPKCIYCGSVLNLGATVCAKCGRDQVPRRPAPIRSVPCPFCNKPIPDGLLVIGLNTCPHCGQGFECEQ